MLMVTLLFSKTAIHIILNCKIMRKSPLQIEDLLYVILHKGDYEKFSEEL